MPVVQVEGKTEDDWVFSGIGSPQNDDDKHLYMYYGDVFFMYDVTNMITFIPHHHNTKLRTKEWVAIYTGIYTLSKTLDICN